LPTLLGTVLHCNLRSAFDDNGSYSEGSILPLLLRSGPLFDAGRRCLTLHLSASEFSFATPARAESTSIGLVLN
jgi:hypothetical protein